jgi:hypothetical protein
MIEHHTVNLYINNVSLIVSEGTTIKQACDKLKVDISRFFYYTLGDTICYISVDVENPFDLYVKENIRVYTTALNVIQAQERLVLHTNSISYDFNCIVDLSQIKLDLHEMEIVKEAHILCEKTWFIIILYEVVRKVPNKSDLGYEKLLEHCENCFEPERPYWFKLLRRSLRLHIYIIRCHTNQNKEHLLPGDIEAIYYLSSTLNQFTQKVKLLT